MIERPFYLTKVEKSFRMVPIVALIGARQVGKTCLMKMVKTTDKQLFLNGQDPEIAELFQRLSVLEKYLRVYLDTEIKGYLLIDEFQFIDGISTMLKLLTDKYPDLRILCSGSSSLDIQQKIEESLAGRVRIIEVLSLSFREYLLFKDGKLAELFETLDADTVSSALTSPFDTLLNDYLLYGGFPRSALTDDPEEKIAILDDIYKTYLLRDVRSYIRNEHFVGFNKLLRLLAVQFGNLLNISELSRESCLPYKKCEEYIALLEQMYIIKLVEPYYTNKRKIITKMKKIYFCDLGLRNLICSNFGEIAYRTDNGSIFENYILAEIWRNKKTGTNVWFYRTSDGVEVDFVVDTMQEKVAIECKYKALSQPVSVRAMDNFCDMEGISRKYIINRNLNTFYNGAKYIQGFLAGEIFNVEW